MCFSIRARDENGPALQPALPQEASDEDEDGKGKAQAERTGMPDSVQRAIKQVETQLLARSGGPKASAATALPLKEQRQGERQCERERYTENAYLKCVCVCVCDVISAEERVKDKLALIARDKLNGMISREKQLQLERKRKAMAFLNQIKG